MNKRCSVYKNWGLGLIVLIFTSCGGPEITSLNPDNGPERTLVEIEGKTSFRRSTGMQVLLVSSKFQVDSLVPTFLQFHQELLPVPTMCNSSG